MDITKALNLEDFSAMFNVDWDMAVNPQKFVFGPTALLADDRWITFGSIGYLVLVLGLHFATGGNPPPRSAAGEKKEKKKGFLDYVTIVHNAILCVWSAAMFYGISTAWFGDYGLKTGFYSMICNSTKGPMKGALAFWLHQYYLSKYYEYLDTFILIFRKGKPLTFLHVFHHAVMAGASYSWLRGNWVLCAYGAMVNTAIHVVMYFYYAASSAVGYRPWWRVHITQAQILQFVTVLLFIIYFISQAWPPLGEWKWTTLDLYGVVPYPLPDFGTFKVKCEGEIGGIIFAIYITVAFLFLFTQMYVEEYLSGKAAKAAKKKEAKNE